MSISVVLLEQGLFQWFTSPTGSLAAYLSKQNVYLGRVPAGANYPCMMIEKVTEKSDTTFDGPSGYVERKYQFNFYGTDVGNTPNEGYVAAHVLQDAVRQAFNGLTGTLPNGVLLFNVIADEAHDEYDGNLQRYQAITDYDISCRLLANGQ